MINLHYTCDVNNPNGNILLQWDHIPIQNPYYPPLNYYFKNSISGKSYWQGVFNNPGDWSSFPFGFHSTVEVWDSLGEKVFNWVWDPLVHGDAIYKYFNCWAQKNGGAFGICIGTHNGTTGEWVEPILNGLLQGLLIEASVDAYNELRHNYGGRDGVSTLLSLVTPKGGQTTFYEMGEGYVNSVRYDLIKNYISDNGPRPKETVVDSLSIVDLFTHYSQEKEIRWMHLDVEGIDDRLILALEEYKITLPGLIIYESLNLDPQSQRYLLKRLSHRGYQTLTCGWNTLAVSSQ
jgi:hypothetical protein